VVSLDAVLAEPISELMSDTLGHPARVDEHQSRAMALDVLRNSFEYRSHLLESRHGSELVVRQLDRDIERPVVPDVDDGTKRVARWR
jgi:hypothetical protein